MRARRWSSLPTCRAPIKNPEIRAIFEIEDQTARVLGAIEHYYEGIKFLAEIVM